jgi:integrase
MVRHCLGTSIPYIFRTIAKEGYLMARTVRNRKIDTRSARARLFQRREPYWTVISEGCALGYRHGAKGGTWIARFRGENGRQHYEALGAADDARDPDGLTVFSFPQAQARARDWFKVKATEQAGDFIPLDRPYTVADAMADYLADYNRRSGKAADRVEAAVGAWILPELGGIPLSKLTRRRLQDWHQKIADTPARLRTRAGETQKHQEADTSPEGVRRRRSTANRVLTILKAALNHAHQEGRCVSDDAWRQIRAFREADAARLRYLSDDEVKRLTNTCPADFRALVTAALLTGCRYGELAAMTIDDFNPDVGTVRVRVSKSGKPRHVVLTEEGRDFFVSLTAGRPGSARLLHRSNGRAWAKSQQQRPLAAASTAARIEPSINFHGLRHTYASRLAMRGVPLAVIAAQLGHSDTRMVEKHYGHLAPNYIADTVRNAFGRLGIVGPSNIVPMISDEGRQSEPAR